MPRRKPGRPRSEIAHKAILKAAKDILSEVGPNRLTVEAVASRAGVGKPTVYRYWSNAQELAMSALMDTTSEFANGDRDQSNKKQLADLMSEIVERLNTRHGRQMALMLAGAEPESELFKAFSNKVILEARRRGLEIVDHAKSNGEYRSDMTPDIFIDMLLGLVFVRLLLRHDKLSPELLAQVTRKFWD